MVQILGAGHHQTSDFEVDRWLDDLDADFDILNDILVRVSGIGPEDDDKLTMLKAFLKRRDVKAGKVLIFSEAEATVQYLYDQLNPDSKDKSFAKLSGANRDSAETIVNRFSPTWNLGKTESLPGPELRTLIATDIVSEGQNRQDCARVLNYDLHWNPVKLIQRFGRVDRIGTEHSTIHLHNMWPDLEVDAQLDLTYRLLNRIQLFHDLIGLDSRLLSSNERLNSDAMYRIYHQKQLPDIDEGLDDVATHQRGVALLQRIQEADPELWQTVTDLPDGIRSALAVASVATADAEADRFIQAALEIEGAQMPMLSPAQLTATVSPFDDPASGETLVLLSVGGITGTYAVGSDKQPRSITPAQFIPAAECEPDAPATPLPSDTNERVMAAFDAFSTEANSRLGRARRPTSDTRVRRYLSKQLTLARQQFANDQDELRRIEVLRRIFLDYLPPRVLGPLRDIREFQLEGEALIRRLEALRSTHRLNPPDDNAPQTQEPQVIRIVCSDGLTPT